MAELFDMVSGTSTGSLLATSIVLPHPDDPKKNKFWAEDAIKIYTERGGDVFQTFGISNTARLLGTLIFALLGGALGYCIGIKIYTNTEHEDTIRAF